MRLPPALLAPIALMAASAPGAQPPPSALQSDKVQLEQLNARWLKSFQRRDARALDDILHPDFIGIYGDRALSKKELMAAASNPARNITDVTWEKLSIHVTGDTAVVTAISSLTGTQDGRDISARSQYADVYVRKDGQWKAVAAHVIRLEDSSSR